MWSRASQLCLLMPARDGSGPAWWQGLRRVARLCVVCTEKLNPHVVVMKPAKDRA